VRSLACGVEAAVTAEVSVARKALAAVCGDVRDGGAADFVGSGLRSAGEDAGEVAGDAIIATAPELADAAGDLVAVASPGSTEEAAAVMRVAAEHELAVVPRGGGSRLSWGIPASRCDLVIDMSRMSGVTEHAAGDLIARVQAGTRMGDVAAVLAQAGQEIALDVPGSATVGGVIASGLAGPRRLRYGTPRDLLIGITIVRADGTVAKSGGKVVKNVAGYDLGKLFAGSAGTLGLITEATFRLHPLPAARAYVTAEYVAVSIACDAVAAAANSPLVSSAVELKRSAPDGPIRVGVLIEGSADGVQSRAMRMADLLGKAEVALAPPAWWGGAPSTGDGETLIRVSFWVSALGRVLDTIQAAATRTGVRPVIDGPAGAGVLYVRFVPEADEGAAAKAGFIEQLRDALAGERGAVTVLATTPSVRQELAGRGGMNGPVPGVALMRAVKDQFDPGHRMAPGRFPETL
jgi:glycolate oxidase FAD binding subunit